MSIATAERLAELGSWTYREVPSESLRLSAGSRRLLGVHEPALALRDFTMRLDEAAHVFEILIRSALERGDSFRHRARAKRVDGSFAVLEIRGERELDADGHATVVGTMQDLTEVSRREGRLEELAGLLRQAESMAQVGHWHWDVGTDRVFWSDEVYRIYGLERGSTPPDFAEVMAAYAPKDAERLRRLVTLALEEGQPYTFAGHLRDTRGSLRRVRAKGAPQYDKDGKVSALFGVIQESTHEEADANHVERLRHAVENTASGVVVADPHGRIVWVNRGFEALTGFSSAEVIGRKPGQVLQGPGTDPTTVAAISDALRARRPIHCEIRNYHKSGEPYWLHLAIHPRFDEHGEVREFVAIETDITAQIEAREALVKQGEQLREAVFRLKRQRDELEWLATREAEVRRALEEEMARRVALDKQLRLAATRDGLTGVANRRAFMEAGRHAFMHHQRYASHLSVIIVDIDHFKRINDSYGHATGDEAIRHVVGTIEGALRRPSDELGRIGGEEFALLLRDTDYAGATVVAERVRRSLESSPMGLGAGVELQITCSLGIAEVSAEDADLERTIARADDALYRAKAAGRNRWVVDDGRRGTAFPRESASPLSH